MRPWDWLLIALLGLLVALVILAAIGFAGTMAFVAVIGLVALIRAASSRNRDRWRLLGLSTFGVVGGALLPPAWLITAYEWPDTSAAAAVPTWVWPVVVIPSYLVVLPAMTMLALGSIRWLTSRPPTESSWIKWSYGFTRPAAVVATFGFATWATHAIYVFNGILR